MAHTATQHPGVLHSAKEALTKAGTVFLDFMQSIYTANAMARELEVYSALSDQELMEKYGMKREDVVQRVLRTAYC